MRHPVTPPPRHRTIPDAVATPPASNQKATANQTPIFAFGESPRDSQPIFGSGSPQDSLFVFSGRRSKAETDKAGQPLSSFREESVASSAHLTPPATTSHRSVRSSSHSAASVPSRTPSTSPFPLSSPVFSFSPPSPESHAPWNRRPPLTPRRPSSRLSQRTATPPVPSPDFELIAPRTRLSPPDGSGFSQSRQHSQSVDREDAPRGSSIISRSSSPQLPILPAPSRAYDRSLREFAESFQNLNVEQHRHSRSRSVSNASDVSESIEEPTRQLEALALSSPPPRTSAVRRPYSILDEEAPLHNSMLPKKLQNALDRGIDHAKAIADVLREQTDPAAQKQFKKAEALAKFKPSATSTIAVLGDSGSGKSSMINALLHMRGIAKVGGVGSACTSVLTEYHQKLPGHTAEIHIEVEYLSLAKRKEIIADLLESYRRFYSPLVQSEADDVELKKHELRSAQAFDALVAAFGHHKEFSHNLLQESTETGRKRALELLYDWSAEMTEPEGSEDGLWRGTAADDKACAALTRAFTTDKFWPFTKVIRIYVDAYILKSGIVLADLPGLNDTNLARVRVTEDYLKTCRHVFIVADIVRAVTDASVKKSVFSVLERHLPQEWAETGARSMDITIVCTKTDSIDIDDTRTDLCNAEDSDFTARVEGLDEQIELSESTGDVSQLEELEQRMKMLFIEARNDLVKRNLQKAYADQIPDGRLRVFCVSKFMYKHNASRGNTELVNASEIPALRTYCTSITKNRREQEARHFLHSLLPILLNSTELWAKTVMAQLDQQQTSLFTGGEREVLEAIEKMDRKATLALRRVPRDIQQHVNEEIIAVSETNHSRWQSAALSHEKRWETWHWTQFNAWCINDGHHGTPKRSPEDWNSNIILQMRTDLASHWVSLVEQTSTTFDRLRETMERILEDTRSTLTEFSQGEIRETLMDQVKSTARDIRFQVQHARTKLLARLQLIQRSSLESNFTSYILTQIMPTYRDASGESGGGKAERQRNTVRSRLSDGQLFPTMTTQLQGEVAAALQTFGEEIQSTMRGVLGQLKADIKMVAEAAGEGEWPRTNSAEEKEKAEQEKKMMEEITATLEDIKPKVRRLEADW